LLQVVITVFGALHQKLDLLGNGHLLFIHVFLLIIASAPPNPVRFGLFEVAHAIKNAPRR